MARRYGDNTGAVDRAAKKASQIARSGQATVDPTRLSARTLEQIVRDSTKNTPLSRAAAAELARRGPLGK